MVNRKRILLGGHSASGKTTFFNAHRRTIKRMNQGTQLEESGTRAELRAYDADFFGARDAAGKWIIPVRLPRALTEIHPTSSILLVGIGDNSQAVTVAAFAAAYEVLVIDLTLEERVARLTKRIDEMQRAGNEEDHPADYVASRIRHEREKLDRLTAASTIALPGSRAMRPEELVVYLPTELGLDPAIYAEEYHRAVAAGTPRL